MKKQTTLLIMVAVIDCCGIKQLDSVGLNNEIIMKNYPGSGTNVVNLGERKDSVGSK